MSDFVKMDVFFAVTTAAIIIVTILLSLVLIRAYRILGRINKMSLMVHEEAREVRADFVRLRMRIKSLLHLY